MSSIDRTIRIQNLRNRVEFSPGMLLGVYRVLRKIGAGGMGAVYEVEHTLLHRHFALKTLFVQGDTEQERQDCIDRFLLEARITSQLRHSGIVSVQTLEQDRETGALYFVMDYVSMTQRRRRDLLHSAFALDSEAWRSPAEIDTQSERVSLSLEDLHRYGKQVGRRMNPELIRRLMMEMAEALDYAHNLGEGIIHRDIKPANILIQEDGHAVLADFGVAKVADSCLRKNVLRGNDRSLSLRVEAGGESYHLILGTMEYMAPELRTGSPPSPQTDLYALGATLYQLLTGELPSGNAAKPSAYGHDPLWDEIVEKALAFAPDDRYASLMAFHDALADFPKVARARRWLRRIRRLAGGAAAVAALAAPLAFFLLRPAQHTAPTEEFRLPRPTPGTVFTVDEGRRSAKLIAVHPDACGRLKIPATVKGKPLTEIAGNAFQNCPNLSGVYLPERLCAPPALTSAAEEPNCKNPACDTCRARRSLLLNVPPGTKPYLVLQQTTPHAQAELPIGTTLTQAGISYRLDERGWVAEAFHGRAPAYLVFPDKIKNIAIYKIGNKICSGQTSLKGVRLPKHLQEIGEEAFSESGLSGKLKLPGTLKSIQKSAFADSAITELELPPGLEILDGSAFKGTKIQNEVILPESLKFLGYRAFYDVSLNQSSFRLPAALPTVPGYTFWNIGRRIARIEIPSQTTFSYYSLCVDKTGSKRLAFHFGAQQASFATSSILADAGHRRIELHFRKDAHISFAKDFIRMANGSAFSGELVLYRGKEKSFWTGTGFVGEVPHIYNGKPISPSPPADAAAGQQLLLEGISYRLDKKGWIAEKLIGTPPNHLVFPDTIKGSIVYKIGDALCSGRKEVKSVRLPQQLQEIGERAFFESGLSGKLDLPGTLKIIQGAAFTKTAITEVVIPPELEFLGESAFQNTKIKNAIVLPDSLKYLGGRAFCGVDLNQSVFRVPPAVATIHPYTFWHMGPRIKHIELPTQKVLVPFSLQIDGTGDKHLSFHFGAPKIFIDQRAVVTSSQLQGFDFYFREDAEITTGDTIAIIREGMVFPGNIALCRGEQYSIWTGSEFVGDVPLIYNGTRVIPRKVPEGVARTALSHEGIFYRRDEKGWIAETLLDPVEHLVFPDTIKGSIVYKIGDNLCNSRKEVKSVRLPQQLQEIGEKAFHYSGLSGEVILPESLKIIRTAAFSNTAVSAVKLPAGLEVLEESGFQNTKIQHEVILPESLKHLGTKPFCGVDLNQSCFRVPPAVETVTPYTFWNIGSRVNRFEFPTQTNFDCNSLVIAGVTSTRVAFHFGAQQVSLATRAIVVSHLHRQIELHFREDAEISFAKNFIFRFDRQELPDKFLALTVYQGKKRSIWTGSEFIGEVPLTYDGVAVTPGEAPDIGSEPSLTHEGICYRRDEKGWVAEAIVGSIPEHLVFPDTVEGAIVYKISERLCDGWKTLKSVRLPGRLQEVGEKAFHDSGLSGTLHLPETLKIIRKTAFANNAITAVELPAGLEILEESGFQNTKIQHEVVLPDTLKHLGSKAFCGVNLNQSVFRVPPAVETIAPFTFWHMGSRINRLEFPTQTQFNRHSLVLDGFGSPQIAFHFGAQQVTLATRAIFANKHHRQVELHFREDAEISIANNFILLSDGRKFTGTIIVYQGKKRSIWTGSEFVGEVPLTYNGVAVTPGEVPDIVSETRLTLEGISYRLDKKGWVAEAFVGAVPEHLVFPDTIEGTIVYKIDDRLCDGRKMIKSVRLPQQLQEIGSFSFHDSGLTGELELPKTVTTIHDGAFANIPTLEGVVLPPKLKTLGAMAFQNDKRLTNVALPDSITHFGDRVFCGIDLDGPRYRIPPKITRTDPRCYWFLGDKVTTIELPSVAHLPPNSMDLTGTGNGQHPLTIKLNAPEVTIDARAIRIYRRLHSRVTLQFRPGATVKLAPEFLYEDVVPMKDYHGERYRITVRIGEQESVWDGTRFVGNAVFTYNNELTAPSADSGRAPREISANDFTVRPEEDTLRILRYTGTRKWVTLPRGTATQTVVVEADAFSGCTVSRLNASGKVRFSPNAFRNATIEQINLDTSKLPELTAQSFNGIIGKRPACAFYNRKTGIYEDSIVTLASMTLLEHNQNLYLLDYGKSKSAILKIPPHISRDGKNYRLQLLPYAFANCPKLSCLILSDPCWQTPEVFSSIPSLSKIKLPGKYAEEADALRKALHEAGITVETI